MSRVGSRSRCRCHERFYLSKELHVGLAEFLFLGWTKLAGHCFGACHERISMMVNWLYLSEQIIERVVLV